MHLERAAFFIAGPLGREVGITKSESITQPRPRTPNNVTYLQHYENVHTVHMYSDYSMATSKVVVKDLAGSCPFDLAQFCKQLGLDLEGVVSMRSCEQLTRQGINLDLHQFGACHST